jgi:hypothetical protein
MVELLLSLRTDLIDSDGIDGWVFAWPERHSPGLRQPKRKTTGVVTGIAAAQFGRSRQDEPNRLIEDDLRCKLGV